MQTQSLFAAIDLGSNSFRLEIGQLEAGHLRRVEYIKETVRQGNGLDVERNLSEEAMQRGWDCLARFAERIAGFKPSQVRAVATQTLREARNREVFLAKAKSILGYPIEVIAGREEARLIYLGVSHLLPQSPERRLVVDIGGRSTELILGKNAQAKTLESYRPVDPFGLQSRRNCRQSRAGRSPNPLPTPKLGHLLRLFGHRGCRGRCADTGRLARGPDHPQRS